MDKKKHWKMQLKKKLRWYPFLIVSVAALIFFVYIPMGHTIEYSLYNVSIVGYGEKFVGLKNHGTLLGQSQFLRSLWNTMALTVMGLLTIPLGFLLAVFINGLGRGKTQSFFRIGFYLPNIITGVSVILMFQAVLQGDGGLLNSFLSFITRREISIRWISDVRYAKLGATILWCWMNTGYSMLVNLASLQSIPTEIYEAAVVDGATPWKKIRYLTIPLMKNCFTFLLVTGVINGLSRFTDLYILGTNSSAGLPGGTLQTILMYIYQFSFEVPNFGISSAGSMILFVLVFIFTMINVKMTGFLNDEESN